MCHLIALSRMNLWRTCRKVARLPFSSRRLSTAVHAVSEHRVGPSITVHSYPIFDDNYAYLVQDQAGSASFAVDPADPKAAIDAVGATLSGELTTILTTHKHWDHAGGNADLARHYPDISVYGPAAGLETEPIPALTHGVSDGDSWSLGNMSITAMHTPCHTKGHMMYLVEASGHTPVLFSGDMLFAGGCGRFFEGTAKDMHTSLQRVVDAVPPETLVFFGHEYTLTNLRFAMTVDPSNVMLRDRLAAVEAARAAGQRTVPTTIEEELATNPFLRVDTPDVAASVGLPTSDPIAVMKAVRERKDNFQG